MADAVKAGSVEHRRQQHESARAEIREVKRMLRAGELSREEARQVRRVLSLARDPRNAETIRMIAYLPLGVRQTPARCLAWSICRTRGWGNLRGDRTAA